MRAFAATAILDAAEEVFAEHGLQAGVDAIAARAGVAVGTLYKHFADRDALVAALLEARFAELLAGMDDARRTAGAGSVEEELTAVLAATIAFTRRHGAFRRTTLQAELPQNHPRRLALRASVLERVDAVVARGRAEGLLGPDPDNLQGAWLLGLLHSMLVLAPQSAGQPPAAVASRVVRQFIHGAAAPR